jgi:hypothetical protein
MTRVLRPFDVNTTRNTSSSGLLDGGGPRHSGASTTWPIGVLRAQQLIGWTLRDVINRLLGADRTFLGLDRAERTAYDVTVVAEREGQSAEADTIATARAND